MDSQFLLALLLCRTAPTADIKILLALKIHKALSVGALSEIVDLGPAYTEQRVRALATTKLIEPAVLPCRGGGYWKTEGWQLSREKTFAEAATNMVTHAELVRIIGPQGVKDAAERGTLDLEMLQAMGYSAEEAQSRLGHLVQAGIIKPRPEVVA
jgi:hypothetical protein